MMNQCKQHLVLQKLYKSQTFQKLKSVIFLLNKRLLLNSRFLVDFSEKLVKIKGIDEIVVIPSFYFIFIFL